MQKEIEKQKIDLHASLKEDILDAIQKDITNLINKSIFDQG